MGLSKYKLGESSYSRLPRFQYFNDMILPFIKSLLDLSLITPPPVDIITLSNDSYEEYSYIQLNNTSFY